MFMEESIQYYQDCFTESGGSVNYFRSEMQKILSRLDENYVPSQNDESLFNLYVKFARGDLSHRFAHFTFKLGFHIEDKVKEREKEIGKEICKEALYSRMAICCLEKNDIFEYIIYLEKMLQQKKLYDATEVTLVDILNMEQEYDPIITEANRLIDVDNTITKRLKIFFNNFSFINVLISISPFQQKIFMNQMITYRLLHASLMEKNCGDIIHEQSFNLIQNLCTLVETALKEKLKKPKSTFEPLLKYHLNEPYKSVLENLNLFSVYQVKNSIHNFNKYIQRILPELETCSDKNAIVVFALFIAYLCRNQVLHNVSGEIAFRGNGKLTEKIIGVLLASVYFASNIHSEDLKESIQNV